MADRVIEVDLGEDRLHHPCPLVDGEFECCHITNGNCRWFDEPAPDNCPLREGPVVVKAKEELWQPPEECRRCSELAFDGLCEAGWPLGECGTKAKK